MLLDSRPYTFDRVIRIGIAVLLAWGAVWLLRYLSGVLAPFVLALLLAYLLHPLVAWIQRRVKHRGAAVGIALAGVSMAALLMLGVVVLLIASEIAHMGEVIGDLTGDTPMAERGKQLLPSGLWQALTDFAEREDVQTFFRSDDFRSGAAEAVRNSLPKLWTWVRGAAGSILGLLLIGTLGGAMILLYLVFLLMDYEKVREGWRNLIPPDHREKVVLFAKNFEAAMRRYFRAQALIALIVGVLHAIGFGVIGLPMGVLLGLTVGLLNMVPYLQTLAYVPAALLAILHALETGQPIWLVLVEVGGVLLAIQALQDGLLVPKIQGKSMGLSPAIILLALAIWGKLLGMLGLLIALPTTCLLLAYYRAFIDRRETPDLNKQFDGKET